MADLSNPRPVARPGANMRLVEALQYRLPLAALVSILHRASGVMMFVLLPFIVWMFDASVTSEISYDGFTSAFVAASPVASHSSSVVGWRPSFPDSSRLLRATRW